MLERAIESEDEEECETWRNYTDNPENKICIRDTVRVIGKSIDSVMFYNMIRNVTAEKRALEEVNHREMLFRSASEQANIYYWEYNIGTKKMRRIAEDHLGNIAVFCGNRFLIIRPKFEEFILNSSEI